jgi:hypothetical protein
MTDSKLLIDIPTDDHDHDDDGQEEEETPETNYFKMMMEHNQMGRAAAVDGDRDIEDDSVIGGATLASMLQNNTNDDDDDDNARVGKTAYDAMSVDSYGYSLAQSNGQQQQRQLQQQYGIETAILPPEMDMSIIGVEDDVSTIANDTVNLDSKVFFRSTTGQQESSGSKSRGQKPRIRLFKEYMTPDKNKRNNKSKRSESSTEEDGGDDAATAPETPPGMMIRVPASTNKKSKSRGSSSAAGGSKAKTGDKDGDNGEVRSVRSKRIYIVAGILAVILFASIIALGVALGGMRKDDDSGSSADSAAVSAPANGNGSPSDSTTDMMDDVLSDWPDLGDGSIVDPSQGPGDEEGEDVPQDGGTVTEAPVGIPVDDVDGATLAPSAVPPTGTLIRRRNQY